MKGWVIICCFAVLVGCTNSSNSKDFVQSKTIQLSDPIISADSILFKHNTQLNVEHGLHDAKLLYTLDGSDVTHLSVPVQGQITIKEDATIQVRAYHPDFKPSEQVSIGLRKLDGLIPVKSVKSSTSPKSPYDKGGWKVLTDRDKGNLKFTSGNKWLGFQQDTVKLNLKLANKQTVSQIVVSSLCDQNAWIFDPIRMEVHIDGELAGTYEVTEALEQQTTSEKFWDVGLVPKSGKMIELTIINASALPEWHSGSGEKGWLFMDEILVR